MKNEDRIVAIIVIGMFIAAAVIGYKIATSDLDPWVKYWLLK